jgi:integrase
MVKEAEDNGLIDPAYATGIDRIKGAKVTSEMAGRLIPLEEIRAMAACCDDTPISIRNKAMIYVMYLAGPRRGDVVHYDLFDYKSDRLNIRHGKGNKDRHCYITDEIKEVMDRWLSIRGYSVGPLFTRIRKSNQVTLNRLTDQAIYYIVKQLQLEAGIESITPHDFRRTFITNLLINKIPIDVVKDMAGHSDISTTSRYNRQDKEAAMSEAVKVLRIKV